MKLLEKMWEQRNGTTKRQSGVQKTGTLLDAPRQCSFEEFNSGAVENKPGKILQLKQCYGA
jgi:hypothetical protein